MCVCTRTPVLSVQGGEQRLGCLNSPHGNLGLYGFVELSPLRAMSTTSSSDQNNE